MFCFYNGIKSIMINCLCDRVDEKLRGLYKLYEWIWSVSLMLVLGNCLIN